MDGKQQYSRIFHEDSVLTIQNKSGQGIDLIGKARFGLHADKWEMMEVKSSETGRAPAFLPEQAKGPNSYFWYQYSRFTAGGPRYRPGISAGIGLEPKLREITIEQGGTPFRGFVFRNTFIDDAKKVDVEIDFWLNKRLSIPKPLKPSK